MSGKGKYLPRSSSVYDELRMLRKFCDAVIRVDDVEFHIHKIILCKCSPYFRGLFERWSAPQRTVFDIPGLSPNMMKLIINFAYTGLLSVTEENVKDVLVAADQFHVTDVVQTCFSFLQDSLSIKNCISIWQLTKICYSSELQPKAYRHILDHFEEVASCDEFLQLSVQELTEILDRDDLNVKMEKAVYEAILHWIAHVPTERRTHIAVLLSKVRLALTSEEYIRDFVISNELVENNTECLPITAEATKTLNCMKNSPRVPGICYRLARPRLPPSILLAIGGWSGRNPISNIEAYDVRADSWVYVANNMEHPHVYFGAVFLNGYVYCIGGFRRIEYFSTVQKLDLSTGVWHEVAPMHDRRCYVSVTVLNGCIYALGGYNGNARLCSAEVYRPENNQWSLIAPMHDTRSDSSCTAFENKIYICGGYNGRDCLQSAEYYSPETNQWTMITPMISLRSGLALVVYAEHVYAVGGFDGHNRLRSAEAYNPDTDTWHEVSPMFFPRSNFGIKVVDERLFVVGGFNGLTTTYNVEYYDAATDSWIQARGMGMARSGLCCCVVPRLPNMNDCTLPRDSMAVLNLDEDVIDLEDLD